VWALALLYAASFGIELTIDNFAALYYTDSFHLSLKIAGVVAGSFGMMNLFARALGGIVSDRCNRRWGLRGRVLLLACTIGAEGLGVQDGDTIRIADTPQDFAEACIALLKDAAERERLSARALQMVTEQCSWEAVAGAFEKLLIA